jgi:hypothetical protein
MTVVSVRREDVGIDIGAGVSVGSSTWMQSMQEWGGEDGYYCNVGCFNGGAILFL